MILQELNLIGFGKFENKKLILKDGINLIYGENESGKSTIHSFIDGMFYGFLRPNVRSALYLDQHKRYDPWNGNRYGGVLRFKQGEKEYRIEREFTKGKEGTKVFDETTGKSITKSIDTGRGRILQPGIHFFDFNTRVFSNTISIKQLGTETDDKLSDEVREKLINITTALDDEISIDNAISSIKTSIDEIGSERAHTRPYARNIENLEKLKDERDRILLEKDNYESYLEKNSKLIKELYKEEEKQKELTRDLLKAKSIRKKNNLEEARTLSEEIKEMESDIISPPIYENSIEKDYNKYEKTEEEKNKLLYNKKDSDLEFLKRDYEASKREKKKSIILIFVGALGGLISSIIGQFLILIPLILFSIYSITKFMKLKKKTEKLNIEFKEMEDSNNSKKIEIQEIERVQNELLSKYEVKGKIEFNRLVSKTHMERFSREKSIRELAAKKLLLKRILENSSMEELELELKELNININETLIDEDLLKESMEKSKVKIMDMKVELNGVGINLNILEKGVSRLVEIEEELHRKEVYKQEFDNKLRSLNLALNTIEELSKDIHNQFAPAINKKVSKIVADITNDKYNKVRVSEDLEISVENPTTKEIINIKNLSGGTIDQLYFALRFGIINAMGENKFPLILDDCFIQYDDNRLKGVIDFLSSIGKERQIILFTCHNREKRIMEKIGLDFNYLHLS